MKSNHIHISLNEMAPRRKKAASPPLKTRSAIHIAVSGAVKDPDEADDQAASITDSLRYEAGAWFKKAITAADARSKWRTIKKDEVQDTRVESGGYDEEYYAIYLDIEYPRQFTTSTAIPIRMDDIKRAVESERGIDRAAVEAVFRDAKARAEAEALVVDAARATLAEMDWDALESSAESYMERVSDITADDSTEDDTVEITTPYSVEFAPRREHITRTVTHSSGKLEVETTVTLRRLEPRDLTWAGSGIRVRWGREAGW